MSRFLTLDRVCKALTRSNSLQIYLCYTRKQEWAFWLHFKKPLTINSNPRHSRALFLYRWGELANTPFSIHLSSKDCWYRETVFLTSQETILTTSWKRLIHWDENLASICTLFKLISKHEPHSHLLSYFEENDPFSPFPIGILPDLPEEQHAELALFWCEVIGQELLQRGLTIDPRCTRTCDLSDAHICLMREGFNPHKE